MLGLLVKWLANSEYNLWREIANHLHLTIFWMSKLKLDEHMDLPWNHIWSCRYLMSRDILCRCMVRWGSWQMSVVNFINICCAAFTSADPKSAKRYWQLDWIFMILDSLCLKALRKTLVKLTPGRCKCSCLMRFRRKREQLFTKKQIFFLNFAKGNNLWANLYLRLTKAFE